MKKIIFGIMLGFGALTMFADDKPSFPGGEAAMKKYISENTRYPDAAKENGVEGIVVIDFLVNSDGSLNNLKVEKAVDPDLEQEAIRVVGSMPAWIPAEKGGTPIEAPAKAEVPFLLD